MSREMKHSGIEWIGDIPKEWKITRGKYLFSVLNGYAFDSSKFTNETTNTMPLIRIRDINNLGTEAYYIGEYLTDYVVQRGEVLIGMDGDFNVAKWKGKDALLNQRVCKLNNFSNTFVSQYAYYILPFLLKSKNEVTYATTVKHLSSSDILNFDYLVPPVSVQQKIAGYLDNVCGEIDEMIVLQETMIEELKAYKQSLITEAVTKGLNPNVPMKDSGINWIGEIPKHWKLEPLKYCFGRRSEKNNPVKTEERLSLSIDRGVTLYAEKTTNLDRFKDDFTQYQIAYPNDIVLNCMNMIVGAVGLSNYMGCVSPVYYVIYPIKQDINPSYYSYLLNIPTIRGVYYSLGKGIYAIERGEGRVNTCRLKVSYNDFGRLEIPVPPIEEQKEITHYIQQKNSEIDSLIALKQAKIEELKEYKKSVIYEYVTGKKEVI